jgi:hypothetical protein
MRYIQHHGTTRQAKEARKTLRENRNFLTRGEETATASRLMPLASRLHVSSFKESAAGASYR